MQKVNKYFAKPMKVDGIVFHSGAEGKRYIFLKKMQEQGKIMDLEVQVPYVLTLPLKVTYIADFRYTKENGQEVVEDVKNPVLAKSPIFSIKKKLMSNVHGIDVLVVDPQDIERVI